MEITHKIGRRKTSVARIYMQPGKGDILVNNKDYKEYFPVTTLQYVVNQPFELTDTLGTYDLKVTVAGGGIKGQAHAINLAVTRALVAVNPDSKPVLKAQGLLTRDPRMVERKKPGQKKARKRFQFSKR